MDIKLLFQILTPLSMGGSVIGLFGDFGDGLFASGYTFEPYKEGGQESGLLGHFRVGNVVRDMDYLGVERAAQFNGLERLKKVKFQINGFGQEVLSINGDVLNKDEQNTTVSFGDIRKLASRGSNISSSSEINMKVQVNRVPLTSLGDSSKSVSINNEDVCTVAFKTVSGAGQNKYDLFYIFSAVEIAERSDKGGVIQGRRVGNRKDTCNHIWSLYEKTEVAKREGFVEGWNHKDGVIHLHQREIGGRTGGVVYLIGNWHNYYLWPKDGKEIAVALEGIIWSGRNYDRWEEGNGGCFGKNPNARRNCYNEKHAELVNRHLGWDAHKGRDYEVLTIRSTPGIQESLGLREEKGIYHSGHCNTHKVCVNYPWTVNRTLTQKLETKGK